MFWQHFCATLVMLVLLPVRRLPKYAMVGCLGRFSGIGNHSLMGPATVLITVLPVRMLLLAMSTLRFCSGSSSSLLLMAQGSAEWMLRRQMCAATCSEFGNALGIGYISRKKYMRIKLGLEEAEPANWMMQQGQLRENWVCELYYRLMGAFYHPVSLYTDSFRVYEPDRRLGGSPDRLVTDATGEIWLLECKTAYAEQMRDRVPPAHSLQMLGLCAIYGYTKAHYICSNYGRGIYLAEVTWTPGFWETEVLPRLRQFADWWTCKEEPPIMRTADKEALLALIEEHTHVTEIPAVSRIMRARECQ